MAMRGLLTLSVGALSGVFLLLGGLFVAAPVPAGAVYGLPTTDEAALFYVRAIGFRDLALAAYLIGLTLTRQHRALTAVLGATVLIPLGDLALLVSFGAGRPINYLLHGFSLLAFAALALGAHWLRRAP